MPTKTKQYLKNANLSDSMKSKGKGKGKEKKKYISSEVAHLLLHLDDELSD